MDVMLVTPRRSAYTGEWITAPNQGLLSIAATLRESTFHDTHNVKVEVIDDQLLLLEDPSSAPGAFLDQRRPDIVGVQALTSNLKNAVKLCDTARGKNPDALTVLGGIAPTQISEELVMSGAADVVVHGEGELTFSELVSTFGERGRAGLREVAGITYRDDYGRAVHNEPRPLVADLDQLPSPARDLADMATYQRVSKGRAGNLITSRGCSYACAYCYSRHQWGRGQRRHSVERALDEVTILLEDYGVDRIRIEDDDFIEDREWARAFCDGMRVRGLSGRLEWEAKGRPNQMDAELLRDLRSAGCFRLLMGVESLDPQLLKRLNRGVTVDMVERALGLLRASGVAVQATVILGIPGETLDATRYTLRWLDERLSGRDIVGACFFTPFHRVDREMAKRVNFKVEVEDTDCYTGHVPVTSSPACSYEELWALYEDMGNTRHGKFQRIGYLASFDEVRNRMRTGAPESAREMSAYCN
jgi:radical SAM superfamily enzyme YgiQ (UPF0313 family)